MPPIVAIIGRPNVGKSVLFNRILGRRDAIVHDTPGITRDRHYAEADWFGKKFTIVDTGGLVPDSDEPMESAIERQAQMAVNEADIILLVVDVRAGVTPLDQKAAEVVRRVSNQVIIVANKVDSGAQENHAYEFASLGLGEPVMISALKGRNTGDLLDMMADRMPAAPPAPEEGEPDAIKIAVIGKPNVGKSSLVNAIIGKETVIVSDIPGTTRDVVRELAAADGWPIELADTAGLRSVDDGVERAGIDHVAVEQVLYPPWTTDWITDQGRRHLLATGITPPACRACEEGPTETGISCPRCGSDQTSVLSGFGATACKALWRCDHCLEPFDYFKPH